MLVSFLALFCVVPPVGPTKFEACGPTTCLFGILQVLVIQYFWVDTQLHEPFDSLKALSGSKPPCSSGLHIGYLDARRKCHVR